MRYLHTVLMGLVTLCLLIVPSSSFALPWGGVVANHATSVPSSWVALQSIDVAPASAHLLEPFNGTVEVAVALPPSDPAGLSRFLQEVSTPHSSQFDHFLSLSQFDQRFGSAPSVQSAVLQYLHGASLTVTEVYPGGLVIDASGPAPLVGSAFHTEINSYRLLDGRTVFALSQAPSVPSALTGDISGVSGLSNLVKLQPYWAWGQNTYQQGVQQQFFAPDLQVPNGLPAVYNSTATHVFGKGETVATVLWDGQRCSAYAVNGTCSTWAGQSGPFDPATVTAYWKSYIPSWEPQPNVAGVPVDGAVAPGSGADYDATQAYVESTLDVEMAGSMAPGANITEVYTTCDPSSSGPQGPTIAQIDDAFTTAVTNPGKLASLNNVTVISNSWGAPEYQNNAAGGGYVFDAAWRNTLIQALATGITVLVSSGDSGNNSVNWPADIGNNTYGMVSVGGVTLNVTGSPATQSLTTACIFGGLQCLTGIDTLPQSNAGSKVTGINHQDAWWFASGTLNGVSYPSGGTTGGPSAYYKEPNWQSFALAGNSQNPSPWRGDADIAGVANNTLIEVETCGLAGASCAYLNATDLVSIAGTSVASPEDAGVLAILSGALGHKLGFIDPTLYSLGYNQTLGKLSPDPFFDVTLGKNSNYPAQKGWDYPTGWGTLNASALLKDWSLVSVTKTYSVTLTESGLAGGTAWSVTLGGTLQGSNSSSNVFVEPNGTYSFTVSPVSGYSVTPSSGSVTVNGGPVSQAITFRPTGASTVTFTQSGLPGGTNWSVTISTVTHYSTTPTVTFAEGNGTYSYTVGTVAGYTSSPSSGTITVAGTNVNQAITFTSSSGSTHYTVTFTESGLPGGTTWTVTLNGSVKSSASNTLSFSEVNGTYTYSIGNVTGYTSNPSSGSTTVKGTGPTVTTTFTAIAPGTYAVAFSATGLATGSGWSVTLSGSTKSSTGTTLTFTEKNGTYSYTPSGPAGYTVSPSSGSVTVAGKAVGVTVTFSKVATNVLFAVTFTESGLPPGTLWSATMNGSTQNSATSSIVFQEANGSYSFSVGASGGYLASPAAGSVRVNGASAAQSVTFSKPSSNPLYAVTFSESGLPSGTSWSVTLNGSTQSSTSTTITFQEANKSYGYSLGGVSGYTPNSSSGTLTVSGAAVNLFITFTSSSPSPSSSGASSFDELLLVLALVAVVAVVVAVLLVRRRKGGHSSPPPPSPPPAQEWVPPPPSG